MSTVAITGHRPERLGDRDWVRLELARLLRQVHATLLYQGMAEGADLLAAEVADGIGIDYVACRPWATHGPTTAAERERYDAVLAGASDVVVVTAVDQYTGPQLYHARNQYMVNHAGIVIAIWDEKPGGGTAATVTYAKKLHRHIWVINPVTKRVKQLDNPMSV